MEAVASKLAQTQAIIFDCDGTLVDSSTVYAEAWATGFQLSGREMSPAWHGKRNGLSEHVLMDAFEKDHNVILDRLAVVELMRQTYLNTAHKLREIEAVTTIARQHHQRVPMAVASGGPASIVVPTLRALGLDGLFDVVVTFDDVGKAKPEPDLLLETARRLGVAPADCLVFEDSEQGLRAAEAANMPVVDVRTL